MQISKIDPSAHESDAKEELVDKIGTYIQEKIVFADNVLVTNAVAKVYDEDVILTYAFSSVVFNVLLRAHKVCLAAGQSTSPHRLYSTVITVTVISVVLYSRDCSTRIMHQLDSDLHEHNTAHVCNTCNVHMPNPQPCLHIVDPKL